MTIQGMRRLGGADHAPTSIVDPHPNGVPAWT